MSHTGEDAEISSLCGQSERVNYQRYGRKPNFVRKHHSPAPPGNKNPFDKNGNSLRCFRVCSDTNLKSFEKCSPGAIKEHVRSQLRMGVPAVNIVHGLVEGMEEELSLPEVNQDLHGENEDGLEDLHALDSLDLDTKGAEPEDVGEVDLFEQLDRDSLTHHISSSAPPHENDAANHCLPFGNDDLFFNRAQW